MDKIVDELVAENIALAKEVKIVKDELDKLKSKELELAYNFQVIALGKIAKIRGVLLAEGVWRGLKFAYEYMKKYASKFVGVPLMVDHGHTKEFGKLEGGRVTKVVPDDTLRCLAFEAELSNEDFVNLLKDKKVDAVSPKGMWKVDEKEGVGTVVDVDAFELSLTASPVCDFCSIFNFELSEYADKLNSNFDEEVVSMDDENFNYTEISLAAWTDEYVDDLPDLAFAYISPGGKKDSEGKSVPRSLRHLPYRDANGTVDLPHVRSALAMLAVTKIPESVKTKVKVKLEGILRRAKG